MRKLVAESCVANGDVERSNGKDTNLATLVLRYTKQELTSYTQFRIVGISKASVPWMKRCSQILWDITKGTISKERCEALRQHLATRYTDEHALRKVVNFAIAFLKYLAKLHFDTRYQAFELFFEVPKGLKTRKHVTSRIVTHEDVENLLGAIKASFDSGEINKELYLHYRALVLFGAFTGQRQQATTSRLTVGQFRAIITSKKPVIDILPEQDKIRMQHYCPIHPLVRDAVIPLLNGRADDEIMFKHLSFERWLKQQKVPLVYGNNHWVPGDLRKFCEQMGDILQWDQSNKNYILTHGISGVDWRFYKSPRPEPVYDIYAQYWGNIAFNGSERHDRSC